MGNFHSFWSSPHVRHVFESVATTREHSFISHSLFSTTTHKPSHGKQKFPMVVEAKSKKGMAAKQYQRQAPPPLPKLEDDGNPKFVIFIRMANVYLWYPLNIVTGGTTAKIMVAAKDNFLGKYIYKDTLTRNLAAVIYREMAMKQFRVLRSATEFKYGYKLVVIVFTLYFPTVFKFQTLILLKNIRGSIFYFVLNIQENNNLRAALAANDVIELPSPAELKTVLDKVKDFFGNAKESFGKMTFLNSEAETSEDDTGEKSKLVYGVHS